MTPPNRRFDLFRLPADYEGPLVPGEPDVNHFDPATSRCLKCIRCRECGAAIEEIMPLPWRRVQR
jgi:hypothetical protein